MSHTSTGNTRAHEATTEPGSCTVAPPQSGTMPRTLATACFACDCQLLDLASRLSADPAPDDALRDAIATLAAVLPGCDVSVHEHAESVSTDADGEHQQHSMLTLRRAPAAQGRHEWQLLEHPQAPKLVLVLRDVDSPREAAEILDVSERVISLLSAAFRRHQSHAKIREMAQKATELFERSLQTEKLASYGQVVAGVLHDLNNPLTAILVYTDYLRRALPRQNVLAADLERLSRIREAAERVLAQTRSLVEYARPSGTQTVAVDLPKIVRNALIFCEHEITQANLATALSFEQLTGSVLGVPGQLTQLFVNLFTNAAHAARPTHAKLRVEFGQDADPRFAVVRVIDNGSGIRAADLEHVFDPFFTTKGEGRGFGLGLSIVRDIVNHHGGRICLDSQEGVGTTFWLWFPLVTNSVDAVRDETEPAL